MLGIRDPDRLNRGGNRQANSAIHRIMLTRMSNDDRTKRYIAREVYKTVSTTI